MLMRFLYISNNFYKNMFGLPDWGVSEKLNYLVTGKTPKNMNKITQSSVPSSWQWAKSGYSVYDAKQNPLQPSVKGASISIPQNYPGGGGGGSSSGGSGGGGSSYKSQGYNRPDMYGATADAYAKQKQKELDMIDNEFKAEQKRLKKMEGNVKGRYEAADTQLGADLQSTLTQLGGQKENQMTGLGNMEIQRAQESRTALDQVRNLLNDLQRRNQAYLSATGNYGSSVPEAMGEIFGRQAFSGLSNVQNQRDNAMREIASKKNEVETFFNGKISDANSSYQHQKQSLKDQFLAQLDAIDQARSASQSAKRQASIDVWKSYTNAKLNLDAQMANYMNSVNSWRAQANRSIEAGANYDAGPVSEVDNSQVMQGLGSNFQATNPRAEANRQAAIGTTRKGATLQDLLSPQSASFMPGYSDNSFYDNSADYIPDEDGNLVDPNTGEVIYPAGSW